MKITTGSFIALALGTLVCVSAVTQTEDIEPETLNGGLTADEMQMEAPDDVDLLTSSVTDTAVPFDADASYILTPLVQGGYLDATGRLMVDVLELDYAFMALQVMTPDGRPVIDAKVDYSVEGNSKLRADDDASTTFLTNEYGIAEFSVVAGQMAQDVVTAKVGKTDLQIVLNIISLQALAAPKLPEVEGGIPWGDLMQANLSYDNYELTAVFPAQIAAKAGETVRISGFMTPLQADSPQRWFLLTSSPPHCYFDIPGGPAGTVEVLAPDGVELSWDPVVIEGRFEPIERGSGTVYRLHDAKRVEPKS